MAQSVSPFIKFSSQKALGERKFSSQRTLEERRSSKLMHYQLFLTRGEGPLTNREAPGGRSGFPRMLRQRVLRHMVPSQRERTNFEDQIPRDFLRTPLPFQTAKWGQK